MAVRRSGARVADTGPRRCRAWPERRAAPGWQASRWWRQALAPALTAGAGLEGLAAATVTATAGVGRLPEPRPFAGHITVARSRHRRGVELRPLTGAPIAGQWVVPEITLVASRLGAAAGGGARYDIVRRTALTGMPEGA